MAILYGQDYSYALKIKEDRKICDNDVQIYNRTGRKKPNITLKYARSLERVERPQSNTTRIKDKMKDKYTNEKKTHIPLEFCRV